MVKKYKKHVPQIKEEPHLHSMNPRPLLPLFIYLVLIAGMGITVFAGVFLYQFEKTYAGKIYPGIKIDDMPFGGKSSETVEEFYRTKSLPLQKLSFILQSEQSVATISGTQLDISFDGKLSGTQAYLLGRSGHILSDSYLKWQAATEGINLKSMTKMNTVVIDETLADLAEVIDIAPEDGLFQFEEGKVTQFKPSKPGRKLETEQTKQTILAHLQTFVKQPPEDNRLITLPLPVVTVYPKTDTAGTNDLGIKELIGYGSSKFARSIAGRVHNVSLAASRLNGRLIPPDTVFSFNDAIGDISAATGYQSAYIIKDGRTVLGDGGGVCQVSTTLFRAALNTGLPIEERNAHAYRVSYYEQDSPPGLDATVFAPGYDLKFKNDTGHHILIQAKTDVKAYTLVFELYGTKDGRVVEMTKPVILSQSPPPPDLIQDDPTLPKDTIKQVDWKASGAKVTFDYKVTRGDTVVFQKSFFSNFRPWQAVFLKGTKEG